MIKRSHRGRYKQLTTLLFVGVVFVLFGCIVSTVTNSSNSYAATNLLPFTMSSQSSLKNSNKKVFAHYFTQFPISYENANPATDYYSQEYLKPTGEGSKYAVYGGFLRDRPLPRQPLAQADWELEDMKTEVRRATEAGIDGFTVNLLGLNADDVHAKRVKLLMQAAQQVDPQFKIMLMPDEFVPEMSDPALLESFIVSLLGSSALHRLEDGSVVVSPFAAEFTANGASESAAWWRNFKTRMQQNHNVTIALVPCFLDFQGSYQAFADISYGFSHWGSRNPAANNYESYQANTSHGMGKIWMQPVSVQDTRPIRMIYDEANNSENFRKTWDIAISQNADWVQIPTWNDYAENTYIAPSPHVGWSLLDINNYYLHQFKFGQAPQITQDTLYISHRVHAHEKTIAQPYSPMVLRDGSSPARNTVEVLSFLTAPGTVTVNLGGTITSYQAEAGVFSKTFPLPASGTISAEITRATGTTKVTSPFSIQSSPTKQDLNYYFVSSGRDGSFTPIATTAKPDLTITNLVTNPASVRKGNRVTFTATVKNIGTAATPANTIVGVGYIIDGRAGTPGWQMWNDQQSAPILPGQSVNLTVSGGINNIAYWTATSGQHTVVAHVDDINRIPNELNENNNTFSRTFSVPR